MTQVRELSTELEKGEQEFEKLSQYIKEYKTRTTEKVVSDVIVCCCNDKLPLL